MPKTTASPCFRIDRLGPPERKSPLPVISERSFVADEERMFLHPYLESVRQDFEAAVDPPSFEVAGPRARIYFDPADLRAAIVTCGGLSPGINDVIRALVMQLWHRYGTRDIVGIRHGYQGLGRNGGPELVPLDPEAVGDIHEQGGTMLGTSRGSPSTAELVDALVDEKIDILFTIGGDGTMRGAHAISREIHNRGRKIAVVGLPKTIDNDIPYVRRSFGFETAVMLATQALRSAHTEAESLRHGIGLVKLMGRHSGYITANATLATGDVNFCLVPEIPFSLEGENGLFTLLERRLRERRHALVVVAEGAGQEYFRDRDLGHDASGNPRLGDIGTELKERLGAHFAGQGLEVGIKYIDPSYLIRSAPANPSDSLFCARLAQSAVHAALAGKTALLIGYWHGRMTHVPFEALQNRTKTIDPQGELWRNVLGATGQPARIGSVENIRGT